MKEGDGKRQFVVAQFFMRLIGIVQVYYFSRAYHKIEYGKLTFFFTLGFLAILLFDFGSSTLLTRELAKRVKSSSYYLLNGLSLRVALLLISLCLYLLGLVAGLWENSVWVWLIVAWAFVDSSTILFLALYKSSLRFKVEAIVVTLRAIAFSIIAVVIARLALPPWYVGIALVATNSLFLAFLITKNYRLLTKNGFSEIDIFKDSAFFKLSFSFLLISFMNQLVFRIDSIMIKLMLGYEHLAIFEVASSIVKNSRVYPEAIASVFFPIIAVNIKVSRDAFFNNIKKQILFTLPVAVLCVGLQFLLGKELILFVFSAKYMESISLMYKLSFVAIPAFLNIVIISSLSASGRNALALVTSLSIVLCNIIMNIILIPIAGITGAAFATLGAEVLTATLAFGLLFLRITPRKDECPTSKF